VILRLQLEDESHMAGISFILALLLGGAAFLFKQAAAEISVGTPWASDVCSTSQMFCQRPEYLFYAAGLMLVIAIGAKLGSLAN
jgi:hypothetical protein